MHGQDLEVERAKLDERVKQANEVRRELAQRQVCDDWVPCMLLSRLTSRSVAGEHCSATASTGRAGSRARGPREPRARSTGRTRGVAVAGSGSSRGALLRVRGCVWCPSPCCQQAELELQAKEDSMQAAFEALDIEYEEDDAQLEVLVTEFYQSMAEATARRNDLEAQLSQLNRTDQQLRSRRDELHRERGRVQEQVDGLRRQTRARDQKVRPPPASDGWWQRAGPLTVARSLPRWRS